MKFTINNLALSVGGGNLTAPLTVEETTKPNRFAVVDSTKTVVPCGIAYIDVSDDVKKGVERTLIRVSVPYTDANQEEQVETVHIVRTGSSLGLIGAPAVGWTEGTNSISNSAVGALHGALSLLSALVYGHAEDGAPSAHSMFWSDDKDPTALSNASSSMRMNNPFVRAALSLPPVEDGGSYNGTNQVSGYARPAVSP